MPIRFRCGQCDRLLGIARRKAGMQIRCPQCGKNTNVPLEDQGDPEPVDRTLAEIDDLLEAPRPAPAVAIPPLSMPVPRPPRPAAVAPKPAPRPDSLFEQDVDDLLGIARPVQALELDEEPRAKPVAGVDAMSLDDGPGSITLSSQKATLIVVAAVVLMLVAFVVGFAIRSTI